jgi:fatty acid desaturase
MAFLYLFLLTGIPFVMYAVQHFRKLSTIARAMEILGTAALITCLMLHIRLAELFLLYWLVPLATWGFFVNFLRSNAEHSTPGRLRDDAHVPPLFRTAEIINSPFDSIFVATRGVNYHLSHHLFPSVPFYRLKSLQCELERTEEYQRYGYVVHGYHRYLSDLFAAEPERTAV